MRLLRERARNCAKTATVYNKNNGPSATCGVAASGCSSTSSPADFHREFKQLYRKLWRAVYDKVNNIVIVIIGFDGHTTNAEVWRDLARLFPSLDITVQFITHQAYHNEDISKLMEEVTPLHPRTGLAFTSYKLRYVIQAIDYLEASSFQVSIISNPEGEVNINELLEDAEDQSWINNEDGLWHRARSDDGDDAAMLDAQIQIDKSDNMKRVLWLIILLARINAGKLTVPRCIPSDVYHLIRHRTQIRIQPAWLSNDTSRFNKRFGVKEKFFIRRWRRL